MLDANTANATEIGASAKIGFSMQIDSRYIFAMRFAGADAGTLLINTFVWDTVLIKIMPYLIIELQ